MRRVLIAVVLWSIFLLPPSLGAAQEPPDEPLWMDRKPLTPWNTPGAAVPPPPPWDGQVAERCRAYFDFGIGRPPETDEDRAVAAAGWLLTREYRAGWGVKLIRGFVDHDLNCQPLVYQTFVFVDGVFAGTVAPYPSRYKTPGMELESSLWYPNGTFNWGLLATFGRYRPGDMACCPSYSTAVWLEIQRTDTGPVLVPSAREPSTEPRR